eukprot:g34459.t1
MQKPLGTQTCLRCHKSALLGPLKSTLQGPLESMLLGPLRSKLLGLLESLLLGPVEYRLLGPFAATNDFAETEVFTKRVREFKTRGS